MAELIADMFVSLDGYAKGVDYGPYFDYGGPELDGWVAQALATPQVLLMGRVTYGLLAEMSGDPSSGPMNEQPKAVFSNTLAEPLSWPNTRLLSGDFAGAMATLKKESDVPIRSIGSLRLVRGLIEHGLLDRLRLLVFPLVVGDRGREPMFAGHPGTGFALAGTTVLDSRLVLLEYRPA